VEHEVPVRYDPPDDVGVANVSRDEAHVCGQLGHGAARFVVQDAYLVPTCHEGIAEVASKEASTAGYEYAHDRSLHG
jgi:hypothetical protein